MAEKNKFGQYFTIGLISDFMVSLITHDKNSRILEPSCGKGVFLDSLVKAGYKNLSAYEIDETLGKNYDFVKFKSFLAVPTTEQYSVVIGNPPYIRWKNIEPELKAELESCALWKKYFNSLCDYLFIFILKSIEHLEENGELIFICTEYWMNTTHSETLRNYMCKNGYFTEIYHFKKTPLFEKVTASFVIFRYVKSHTKRDTIKLYNYIRQKGLPSKEALNSKSCFEYQEIPHFKSNSRWILASKTIQDDLCHFEKCCATTLEGTNGANIYRIGDFCDIGNGMVSGLDAAFKLGNAETLNEDEQKVIIKVMKAKDLYAYENKSISNYIFIQEKYINRNVFEQRFPNLAKHFLPYIERLEKRYSYGRSIPYWEFVFPRNQSLFERKEPRIFVPCKERISNKDFFRFCYAPNDCFPTQDVTAIFKNKNCKESIEYILAYLNNKRVFEWLKLNGIVKGEIVEFSEAPIASIPYRPINWNDKNEILIHQKITNEVRVFLEDSQKTHIDTINKLINTLFYE